MNKHLPVLITLLTFGSFGVVGDDAKDCARKFPNDTNKFIECINASPQERYVPRGLNQKPEKIKKTLSLICNFQKSNASSESDVKDKYGRRIGSIEEKDNNKYALNIKISGDSASLNFDKNLLPKSFKSTNLTGKVRTSEDWYYITYEPNTLNKSLISINRYSGSAEIEEETFGGWGEIARDFVDAYEGKSSSKPTIIGSCEGGTEKKF